MENKNLVASQGLKLIRTAQILSIIAAVAAVVGAIVALVGVVIAGGNALEMQNETLALGALGAAGIGGLVLIAGGIVSLIAFIMQLVGVVKAGPAHASYKTAMIMIVINIALGILSFFVGGNMIVNAILQAVSPVVMFLAVYFVLSATIALLREKSDETNAASGAKVRMMYLVATAISVLAGLLDVCPVLPEVASIVTIIGSVIEIVALFLYIGFLGRSVRSLGE